MKDSKRDTEFKKSWVELIKKRQESKRYRLQREKLIQTFRGKAISNDSNIPLAVKNMMESERINKKKIKKQDLTMTNLVVIKAPEKLTNGGITVFLAGSIEMGKATDWQTKIQNELNDKLTGDDFVTLYNPRRDDWDSSWEQTMENDNFREQVEWELNALEKADKIVVYIDPKTTSPITLLEIGLHATSNKMCVCCPEGFYRKGNVDVVCNKYNIPMVDDIDGLIKFILG